MCDILPPSIKTQCLSFVEEYAVMVVQLIVQELDPQQVCIAIGLCQQAEPGPSGAERGRERESEGERGGGGEGGERERERERER